MSNGGPLTRGLSFLGQRLPAWVDLRVIAITSGHSKDFDPAAWRDALVLVERGQVILETLSGQRYCCEQGFVGYLAGLPLRALRNEHCDLVLISAVSRATHRASVPDPGWRGDQYSERPPS